MTSPRYQVRFSNGYWKAFDTFLYKTVREHDWQADAYDHAAWLNNRRS